MALVRLTADTLETAFVVNDTGGDGSLSYLNGEFVYTGPSASEVRAHFSASTISGDGSLTYDSTSGAFSFAGPTSSEYRNAISITDAGGDGSLTYDSATGVITYTGPSATEVRSHFTAGTGVSITDGDIAIGQAVGTTDNVTFNDLIVSGNLTVSGTTTTVNTTTINLADNIITLNSNATGSPTQNAGIEVVRGSDATVSIQWNETLDVWELTNDGSAYEIISTFSGSYDDLTNKPTLVKSAPQWTANHTLADGTRYLTGDVVYNNGNIYLALADNESEPTTNTTYWSDLGSGNRINIDGRDVPNILYSNVIGTPTLATVATSGSYNDLTDLPTIPTDTNELTNGAGFITLADIPASLTAGTGVTIDGSNVISIGQSVATTDAVTFSSVTISSTVTNSTDAATKQYVDDAVSSFSGTLEGLSDVSITSPTSGQVLKYDGTAWVNDTDNTGGGGGIALTDISVTDSGGDGSLSYDNTTGAFTYTGPSATEVRAHFSAGTGISISGGVISATGGGGSGGLTGDITEFDYGSFTMTSFNDELEYVINQISDLGTFKATNETTINAGTFADSGDLSIIGSSTREIELSEVVDNSWDINAGNFTPSSFFQTPLEWVVKKLNEINFGSYSAGTATAINLGTYTEPEYSVSNPSGFPNSALQNSSMTINGTSVELGGTRTINLSDIGTITLTSPSTGQVLKYDGTAWVNDQVGGLTLTSLSASSSGNGSLSYNNTTGVFTYTGPSATEVRSHFSAGTGISITSGEISATPYMTWEIVTTNTTCVAGKGYFVNTSSGAITMTLPASATLGDTIRFNDLAGTFATNNLTVNNNGHNIHGQLDTLVISQTDASIGLVYSNSTYGWKLMEL